MGAGAGRGPGPAGSASTAQVCPHPRGHRARRGRLESARARPVPADRPPAPLPRLARRPSRATVVEALLVVAGYLAVAVHATWPLAKNPLGGFYGFGNDNLGGIWTYGAYHDGVWGPASTDRSTELQAPFGYALPDQVLQPMDRLFSVLFGGMDQGLGAYNAQIFLSFVLAGCTMYLLARYLTGNRAAAAVAGFIYTYSPFHLALAMQYNSLAAIEWVPLYLLALIVFLREPRPRNAAITGAAYALVALTSYYYAWFVLWGTFAIVSVHVVRLLLRRRRAGGVASADVLRFVRTAAARVGLAAATALAIIVPLVLPSLQAAQDPDVADQASHPLSEAVRYSMRPWMLLLPPHDNPFVDGEVERTILTHLYDVPVYEQAIYLGWGVLLLAGLGLWRRGSGLLGPLTGAGRFARPLLVAGVLGGLLIMLGPFIPLDTGYWRDWASYSDSARLPSIGSAMFALAPTFRFFVRAFIIVSPCLAALAALGFARLVARPGLARPATQAALAAAAVAVIGLEFTNAPPRVFASDTPPAWVSAVRDLPGEGAIADYPLAEVSSPRSLYYMFWQREHGRPTVNPAVSRRAKDLSARIANPDDPAAGRALREAGIEYAVVHTDLPPPTTPPYQPALGDDSLPADTGSRNPWFDRVGSTRDAVIYRVRTAPRPGGAVVARTGAGFGAREQEEGTTAQWLQAERGEILVFGADGGRVRLSMVAGSFARPRRLTIEVDGRTVTRVTVPGSALPLRVDLGRLAAGTHIVSLRTTPGPEVIGNGDPRAVSIRVRDVSAEAVRP